MTTVSKSSKLEIPQIRTCCTTKTSGKTQLICSKTSLIFRVLTEVAVSNRREALVTLLSEVKQLQIIIMIKTESQ